MQSVRNWLDRVHMAAMSTLFIALVVIIFVQILMRYLLKSPPVVTEELSRFILIYLCMIGASYVSGRRAHLSIEIVRNNPRFWRLSALITELLKLGFIAAVMLTGGFYLNQNVYLLHQTSAVLKLPLFCVYIIMPICGVLMLIYCAINIVEIIKSEKK